MYIGLKHTHYTLMIFLLILLLFTVGRFFINLQTQRSFSKFENIQTLLVTILAHIQLVIGLVMFFIGPWFDQLKDMGSVMGDSDARFMVVEHPLTMIIAITLITIGRARQKRAETDAKKYKSIVLFFGIGLVLILLRIPWDKLG